VQSLKQDTALKRIQANEQRAKLIEELNRQKAARDMAELQLASYRKQSEQLLQEIEREAGQGRVETQERQGKQDIVLASQQLREIKKRGRKPLGTENQAPRKLKSAGRKD